MNNDSVDELVILNVYNNNGNLPFCGYSVYGIKNGKVTTFFNKEMLFYEVGGPHGHISVANYRGSTVFVVYADNGETGYGAHRGSLYTIYDSYDFQVIAATTLGYTQLDESIQADECTINEKSCTYNEYLSFVDSIKPIKTLNCYGTEESEKEMNLNDLLNYIKTSTNEK